MTRVAVFASGSGSNLQAILDQQTTLGPAASAQVVLVASDHADAGALERARAAGITAVALDKAARTNGLAAILATHRIELVVLAGYMRLIPADVVAEFHGRMLNVHPALLPAFGGAGMYGHRVHEAVIARGMRLTGPTVHFVDERYDEGPIIAQWPVPVLPDDTPDELAKRVLEVEHVLYPRVVEAVAAGHIRLDANNRVVFETTSDLPHFGPVIDVSAAREHLGVAFRAPARH
jgi:formyltetrahydrofolate-dependent phosphoribosylglycinamide formyltransferase